MAPQPNLAMIRSLALKNIRSYAAAPAQAKQSDGSLIIGREGVCTTKVSNVNVASVETNRPLSKLAIYFKAGPRYESAENQGVVNALRCYASLAGQNATSFGMVRSIEQAGGNLYCTTGREHIAYTIEATRDKINNIEEFLREITVNQAFKPWEIAANYSRINLGRDQRTPEVRVLEMIHKTAYRRGLGNSLYCPKHMVGKHSPEMLADYVRNNYVEASVVGVGYPHDRVVEFASKLKIQDAARNVQPSKFYSGESRKSDGFAHAYVALAIEGASAPNQKEVVACSMAQVALGIGPSMCYGNINGKLSQALAGNEDNASASAFTSNYSDSGILGVLVVATPDSVEKVTKSAADILRNASFNDEDVARAKAMLKSISALSTETDDGLLEDLGLQSLIAGNVLNFQDTEKLIDSITAADMNNALKNGKNLAVASFGNITNAPYLDELN